MEKDCQGAPFPKFINSLRVDCLCNVLCTLATSHFRRWTKNGVTNQGSHIMQRIRSLFLIFLVFCFTIYAHSKADGQPSQPGYTIAFASFAPLNTDMFLADANGRNIQPFLAHPAG